MKSAFTSVIIGALLIALGCNKSEPGGPAARSTDNRNSITRTPKHETFRVSAPATTTTLKQGEQKEVSLEVERSADFKQDVTLTFKGDKGVTITPASTTVKASSGDTNVKVMVAADNSAPVGEAVVHVTAKPESGDSTSAEFKVNVKGS
jgi:uncharacterized membrane protein